MSINSENLNSIRKAMEVHCGLTYRTTDTLTYSISGAVKIDDNNIATSLYNSEWDMRHLADFSGSGFPLDGSCQLYDGDDTGTLASGKLGIRSDIGGTFTVTVTALSSIAALTIAVTSGSGTITANGVPYEARRITVVPVNNTSVTLTIASDDAYDRIEIASIIAGVVLDFTNDDLISVNLDLRSDLSIIGPTWQVSGIEIEAYWPNDISSAVANIGDDVPIWYYSGYTGDYSDTRNFYVSEQVTMENNIITIKGEDQSHKFESAKDVALQRLDTLPKNGWRNLYLFFRNIIQNAGIKAVSVESPPSESGTGTTQRNMILTQAPRRDYVADIMNMAHVGTFWPTFVDAGIPTITWTKPSKKWDIYEEDCGDVKRFYERNVAKITTDTENEHGVSNTVTKSNTWKIIEEDIKIENNVPQIRNYSYPEWYWAYEISFKKNDKFDWQTLDSVKWTPSKTTTKKKTTKTDPVSKVAAAVTEVMNQPNLYAKKVTVTRDNRAVTIARPGVTEVIDPLALGKCYQGTTLLYPNYARLFNISNVSGSFTWKGHPKMQPRDVFDFHRLDGTTETCTIETINLKHEHGGTQAEITYRLGVR